MTNRNLCLSEDTKRVLIWAARAQKRDDTVREFWNALCDRFDISTTATGERVFQLLCKAGSHSHDVAHIFRGNPVRYSKVCWYIAEKLRPIFGDAESTKEDILACEKYVLKKMKISEDDLEMLCLAIRDRAESEPNDEGAAKATRNAAVEGVSVYAARMATMVAAEKAMAEASKKVAAEVENQAAKLVLAGILTAIDIALAELTLINLADPAYRKAVPGVTYVAILRKLHAVESAFRARAANKSRERPRRHSGWRLSPVAVG
jgi:hypothetical protein